MCVCVSARGFAHSLILTHADSVIPKTLYVYNVFGYTHIHGVTLTTHTRSDTHTHIAGYHDTE